MTSIAEHIEHAINIGPKYISTSIPFDEYLEKICEYIDAQVSAEHRVYDLYTKCARRAAEDALLINDVMYYTLIKSSDEPTYHIYNTYKIEASFKYKINKSNSLCITITLNIPEYEHIAQTTTMGFSLCKIEVFNAFLKYRKAIQAYCSSRNFGYNNELIDDARIIQIVIQ